MNVFVDFHHGSLLKSFILLFEKRFGGNVYRPIGMEWAENGFWKVYDHPATQAQYLGIGSATPDGTPPLNELDPSKPYGANGIFHCKDIEGDETNKAITFVGFMDLPIDIVIASLPAHIEPFRKLCQLHPSHPKLIFQIGNAWTIEAAQAPNVMASAKVSNVPEWVNFIEYHQEFDTSIFNRREWMADGKILQTTDKNIYSFINCFNLEPHFQSDWQLFLDLERRLPDWSFKSFGGQCRDGSMNGSKALADKMRESRFIWHTKNGGDGYGHVLHNTAAVGRPTIAKLEYYRGKLGEELLVDGQTCIAIDNLTLDQIIDKINYYSEPNQYAQLCHNVYDNFLSVVNFTKEAEAIREFLTRLK